MQININKLLKTLNYLSIDVATGAALNSYIINKIFFVSFALQASLMLFGTVLIIYWLDHYIDLKNTNYKVTQPHHLFVIKHQAKLVVLSLIIFVFLIIGFFSINVEHKFILSAVCLLMIVFYFWVNQYHLFFKFLPKEFIVSLIYSFGITSLAFTISFSFKLIFIFILLILVTMQNMLMINNKEWYLDKINHNSNLMKYLSSTKIKFLSGLLFFIQICLSMFFFISKPFNMLSAYVLSLVFVGLVQQIVLQSKTYHYRIYGENAYLIPAFVFLFF